MLVISFLRSPPTQNCFALERAWASLGELNTPGFLVILTQLSSNKSTIGRVPGADWATFCQATLIPNYIHVITYYIKQPNKCHMVRFVAQIKGLTLWTIYICSVQGAAEGIGVPEERMVQKARYGDMSIAAPNTHVCWLIIVLIKWLNDNNKKCPSQYHGAQSDTFRCLVLYD